MPRYVCIHGHFYQPPRENPWLETVELQESAAPWHDWNARISAECYSRNAASRILNDRGDIRKICNNYSRMSFNIGPTLLTWLEEKDHLCYEAILEADRQGRKRFSGHGPAMAQVYNHIIMPLASRRDKETQVKWGIADFRRRFNRMPEGMWLAECAVDTETLEVLAENGILFTVLSPWQAKSVRAIGWKTEEKWQDVSGAKINTTCAYKCNLPSGRSIAIFFYDGVLSQKIAFGGLLNDGGAMARGLIDAHPDRGQPVLSHVATDGESYGHHHKHGDMALAYCLESIDNSSDAQLTVYGEYLAFYPPESEVQIIEPSSWSCAHGVERWCNDCPCGLDTPGYHHKWRKPLREAMNYLRDELAELFVKGSEDMFFDAWNARNRYIDVILDRSDECVNAFLKQNTTHILTDEERIRALSLMEMERNSLLMFTSCGWFFDEISRIEPVQIMRYAARAIELAKELFGVDLEPSFLKILAQAPSNVPELQDGAKVYELLGKQGHSDTKQMAAYYGITSLLRDFRQDMSEGCWDLSGNALKIGAEDKSFSAGKVHVHSHITGEEGNYLFAVNRNSRDEGTLLLCGICEDNSGHAVTFDDAQKLREMFSNEDNEGILFEKFGYDQYTLTNIPLDARHKVVNEFLQQDVEKLEANLKSVTKNYDQLLEYLTLLGSKPPAIIITAAKYTLTSEIVQRLGSDHPDAAGIRRIFEYAGFWQVEPDEEQIRFAFAECINRILAGMCISGPDPDSIKALNDLIRLFTEEFFWHLSLYDAQNLYYELLKQYKPDLKELPALHELGRALRFSDEFLLKSCR